MAVKPPTEDDARDQRSVSNSAAKPTCQDDNSSASTGGPAALEAELVAEKDRTLRLHAEMENLRNRTAREIADQRRYAPLPVVRDLLPVLDNIDRAIDAAQQSGDATSLLEGFQLVRQQLLGVLERHHCRPIDAVGKPFDPQIHEALLQQPSDQQPAGHVLQVTQAGYMLHDRVVRPSQVIVSSGPSEPSSKEQ